MTNEIIAQSLEPEILKGLNSYEDYLAYYTQLDEVTTSVSWVKADLLLHMQNQLGDKSILALSIDIKQPYTTVVNYIRTARAFPLEKRLPNATFTHHYQASYADKFNENTKEFEGNLRFKWLEKAADNHWSVTGLIEHVKVSKLKDEVQKEFLACTKCSLADKKTRNYVLYALNSKKEALRFNLCDECFLKIADYIYGAKAR